LYISLFFAIFIKFLANTSTIRTTSRNNFKKQLQETTSRNNFKKQLQETTSRNNFKKQLQETTSRNKIN